MLYSQAAKRSYKLCHIQILMINYNMQKLINAKANILLSFLTQIMRNIVPFVLKLCNKKQQRMD